MTRLESLQALYGAVGAGGNFVMHDEWIEAWEVALPEMETYQMKSDGVSVAILTAKAMRGSVDAALAFIAATLPGRGCAMNLELGLARLYGKGINGSVGEAIPGNLAAALLFAGLAALIVEEKTK